MLYVYVKVYSPVSHGFPDSSHQQGRQEGVEETLKDERQILEVIAVYIDTHETAAGARDSNKQ